MKNKYSFKFGVIVLSLVLIACSGGSADAGCPEIDGREINVVATTPMIGEFVNQIGGDSINLTVLMPPEANPHTYEPAPQDAGTIADADLVFYTGLMYEPAPLIELLENSVCGSEALAEVGESVFPIEFKEGGHDDHHDDHGEKGHDDHDEEGHDDHDEEGHDDHDGHEGHGHGAYDPHFWFDPNRVAYAAEFIESKLVEFDPSNSAVYEAAGEAIDRARQGGGPTLLECKTYRYYDHVGVRGMGLNYRTDEEVEEWKNKDAIEAFEKRLVQLGVMTKKKIENVHKAISKDIEEAIAFANDSPYPLPEELLENVYNEEA